MSEALAFLGQGEAMVFTVALVLMLMIGVVEAIGLGGSAIGLDADADIQSHGALLDWLGFGRLPLLMLIVVFLCLFGVIGLAGQQLLKAFTGHFLSPWLAAPAAALAALPPTGLLARALARILPRDETTAIDVDELVGLRAVIVTGEARPGYPARARVRDRFGLDHYVMAEPDNDGHRFAEGESIILVRRHDQVFRAISEGRSRHLELD